VNDAGVVVGNSAFSSNNDLIAWVWSPTRGFARLADVVENPQQFSYIEWARAINGRGQILASAARASGPDPFRRSLVLTPLVAPADTNCDARIDFFDIDPFLLALFDPAGYTVSYPACDIASADVNLDGAVDFFDIDAFVACVLVQCP
jgi:hypothetical protein